MANIAFTETKRLIDLLRPYSNTFVRVLDDTRLAIGSDPLHPSKVVDLSSERVTPYSRSARSELAQRSPRSPATRKTGNYWIEVLGRKVSCDSKKEILINGLKAIEQERPGTLEKLSNVKPRKKRIVACDPNDLFDDLGMRKLEDVSQRLDNNWWVGTNNSGEETKAWFRRACKIAKLRYGDDFRTSLEWLIEDLAV